MADTQVTPWGEINVDESISENEQSASNDISTSTPVGKFLCKVVECNAVEKNFNAYTCYAANLKFVIEKIIEIEQTTLDDKGQPLKRNGEIVMKKQPVTADKLEHYNNLNIGKFLFDDVNLFNPAEKEAMKKRRLFVAKKLQIITQQSIELPTSAWANVIGKQVIIETEWNTWKDKTTDEIKRNVKVAWSGYEMVKFDDDVPFGNNDADKEDFDI